MYLQENIYSFSLNPHHTQDMKENYLINGELAGPGRPARGPGPAWHCSLSCRRMSNDSISIFTDNLPRTVSWPNPPRPPIFNSSSVKKSHSFYPELNIKFFFNGGLFRINCSVPPLVTEGVDLATNLREDFTITENAPIRAFSWLKVPISTLTFKTLC